MPDAAVSCSLKALRQLLPLTSAEAAEEAAGSSSALSICCCAVACASAPGRWAVRSGLVLAAKFAWLVLACSGLVFGSSVSDACACVSGNKSPSDCVLGNLQQLLFE